MDIWLNILAIYGPMIKHFSYLWTNGPMIKHFSYLWNYDQTF